MYITIIHFSRSVSDVEVLRMHYCVRICALSLNTYRVPHAIVRESIIHQRFVSVLIVRSEWNTHCHWRHWL